MIDRLVKVKSKLNSSQQKELFFFDNLYLAPNALSYFLKRTPEDICESENIITQTHIMAHTLILHFP
jgi:hypothetical protein